jgi:hypothetical protein
MKNLSVLVFVVLMFSCGRQTKQENWVSLFNGKDLTGWSMKIAGYPLNENFKNIFGVKDSLLTVSYAELDSFRGEYGHLFYNRKFSNYKLRLQYRFYGNQCPGGADWALRNSGAMLHCQSLESMGLKQDFPVSIEAQFLGGLGNGERPTLNVCTPGTDIDIDGKPVEGHCTSSTSKTYNGDQWVSVELVVLGDSIIHHIVNGDTVMTYTHPRIGPDMKPEGFTVPDGTPLKEGYIALQAESHGVQFRRIEILELP